MAAGKIKLQEKVGRGQTTGYKNRTEGDVDGMNYY